MPTNSHYLQILVEIMSSPLTKPASPWAVKIAQEGKDQGLPHKKIRQKLVLQGLEPELIDNVLNGDMDSSGRDQGPLEPSSPPTSPMRRQVSTRSVIWTSTKARTEVRGLSGASP